MHDATAAPAAVIFGLDPMWFAAILFILTYAVIMTERINRAVIALLAAGLMIIPVALLIAGNSGSVPIPLYSQLILL